MTFFARDSASIFYAVKGAEDPSGSVYQIPLLGGPSMCLARAFEPRAALVEPGVDHLDDPVIEPLEYS